MPREFELAREVELAASPEQVWEAIATGPGLTSWFMPHEVEPREGGAIVLSVGGFTAESTVTAWDPPKRFAARGETAPDGTVHAFEYLIEGRAGGSTVLRFVHSGLLGDDWGEEYEIQSGRGWDMYLHTLGQYLRHFPGRTARYVFAEGSGATGQDEAWVRLVRGLGLPDGVRDGDPVRTAPDGLAPIDGVADYVRPPYFAGLRTRDALYRFHVRPDGVGIGHHVFTDDVDPDEANRAWRSWLDRTLA